MHGKKVLSKRETDVLKGIAILSVILSHTNFRCTGLLDPIPVLNIEGVPTAICEAGMSLFLFISGYGLQVSYGNKGLNGYWSSKIKKVLIPYIIVHVITVIIYFFYHKNATMNAGVGRIKNLMQLSGLDAMNQIDPSMWYISYILFWYFVFWFAHKIFGDSDRAILLVGIIALSGFVYVPWYWGANADYCIMTFFVGMLASGVENRFKCRLEKISTKKWCFICIVMLIIGYLITLHYHRVSVITENIGALLSMFSFILIVKLAGRVYNFPLLFFFGTISYWLYLLEWKILFTNIIYDNLGINYASYAISFAVTVFASFLCHKAYSKAMSELSCFVG